MEAKYFRWGYCFLDNSVIRCIPHPGTQPREWESDMSEQRTPNQEELDAIEQREWMEAAEANDRAWSNHYECDDESREEMIRQDEARS